MAMSMEIVYYYDDDDQHLILFLFFSFTGYLIRFSQSVATNIE